MEAQTMDKQQAESVARPATYQAPPAPTGAKAVAASQPFLALSGLGLAYGSLKAAMRKIKRATSLNFFKLPRVVKTIPKYMQHNYVKYPLLLVVFLAATRRVRAAINH